MMRFTTIRKGHRTRKTKTPLSTHVGRGLIVFTAFLAAVSVPIQLSKPASADQYDDKIAYLTQQMAQYQSQADSLAQQADTLQNALDQIASDKAALQSQIDLNQAQADQLAQQIIDTENQIKTDQDALGKTLSDLYVAGDTSPLEMLASSKNVSDYLDKQEQQSSIRDQLNSTIKEIQDLKTQLTSKKADVDKVLAEEQQAKDAIVAKQNEQATLLAQTNNNEANYQSLIASNQSQINAAKAAQAAIRARQNSTGGFTLVDAGSLSDYPWNSSNCPMVGYMSTGGVDGNGTDGHGYGCRQCVSYVAWRVAKATGVYYNNLGNGGSAAYNLARKGYQDLGSTPQAGSVGSLYGTSSAPYSSASSPGHTAYVEAVDGDKILVSQYNYNYGSGWGMYSEMWLSANFFDDYVKVD